MCYLSWFSSLVLNFVPEASTSLTLVPTVFPRSPFLGFPSFIFHLYVCEVAQLCPTLCDPMDCSLPHSFVHGIFQARVLEWVAISFSRGSS